MADLNGKRIAILATHGFEQSELTVPRDRLREMGAEVQVISPEEGPIRGWKGSDCSTLDVLPAAAASPGIKSRPNWGAAQLREGSMYYTFVGAKRNTSAGASDAFASNAGLHLLRSTSPTGPFEDLGEEIGLNGQSFGFRDDAKINPVDGALLLLTEGYAHGGGDGSGFGFIFRRSASGSALGPWTEHLVYELGMRVTDGAEDWMVLVPRPEPDRSRPATAAVAPTHFFERHTAPVPNHFWGFRTTAAGGGAKRDADPAAAEAEQEQAAAHQEKLLLLRRRGSIFADGRPIPPDPPPRGPFGPGF